MSIIKSFKYNPFTNLKKRKNPSKPSKPSHVDNDNNEDELSMIDPLKQIRAMMGGEISDKDKNHIYFYGDVDSDSCLDLNRKITDLNKELLKYAIDFDAPPPNIYLHINSNGGCLLSAMSTVDTIRSSRVPIVSIVEGSAASAATIISMACHRRYITTNSFMLIHQLSSGMCGKYEEIKDDFINDTKFMERLYTLYKTYTKMTPKQIKQVLTRDIWWDSDECVKNGLVDDKWNPNMTSLNVTDIIMKSNHYQSINVTSFHPMNDKVEEVEDEDEEEEEEDEEEDEKEQKKKDKQKNKKAKKSSKKTGKK